MHDLLAGIDRFQRDVFPEHRVLFEDLAEGQNPDVLFVTCSDSRVDPSLITQTSPGELFVHRNAGNLVPPYGDDGSSEAAGIEYAVKHLGVKHVVVCGHSGCGAMHGLVERGATGAMKAWLKSAATGPLLRRVESSYTPEDRHRAAIFLNIIDQLANLRSHPCVKEAEQAGTLQIHGWVYDIRTSRVHAFDPESRWFTDLHSLYASNESHGAWEVLLTRPGRDGAGIRRAVAQVTGLSELDAGGRIRRLPAPIVDGLSEVEARIVAAWLEGAGGTVHVREGA